MKQKLKITGTSVTVYPEDLDFLHNVLNMKNKPGFEYSAKAFRLMYLNTLRELRGQFTGAELMAIVELSREIARDRNISPVDFVPQGFISVLQAQNMQDLSLERYNVSEDDFEMKLNTLTACEVFVLKIWATNFIIFNKDKSELTDYIKTLI